MALRILSALDAAKIQCYHFKAIIIAGMGLFTDAYDLFCIPHIMDMIKYIYYHKHSIPTAVQSVSVAIALLGTALGQLIFGYLGDRVGRRRVYGICLMIMILSSLGCGFSVCTDSRSCVMVSLGFFRFVLGIGIGGDYPLSATIMSEFANKRKRGAFIAAVFSMQGFGILASSAVTMLVCHAFSSASSPEERKRAVAADLAWRLILMLGAVPAALTLYWRMLMPETARYTALVANDVVQTRKNMQPVLAVPMSQIPEEPPATETLRPPSSSYSLFSRRFFQLHGRDLFAASANWFLVDVVFYTSNLFLNQIFNLPEKPGSNVYESTFRVAKFKMIFAAAFIIPGYWFTVLCIEKIGRIKIQIMGFSLMAFLYLAVGIPYRRFWSQHGDNNRGFMVLYGLIFFFSNFGPNTTTFIIPAEQFPARFRSTCNGISGAVGKLGAIVGAVSFLWATDNNHVDKVHVVFTDVDRMTAAFLILGCVCVAGIFVTSLFTSETMGRSLEDNEHDEDECNC